MDPSELLEPLKPPLKFHHVISSCNFKSLSSLPSLFRVITGLDLYMREDRPLGAKRTEKSAIWSFSRRAVRLDVLD